MTKNRDRILAIAEGALMIALAFVVDMVTKAIPLMKWPAGGSVNLSVIPIIFYSYRRGWKWGLLTAGVNSIFQIISGWYAPPAGTFGAFVLCILLDYVLAYSILGIAELVAKPFKYRLLGYGVGAAAVTLIRFVCSFLSGILIWGSYAPEGQPVWLYSLVYNGGYMIPNAILATVVIVLLCLVVDPKTLHPMIKKKEKE